MIILSNQQAQASTILNGQQMTLWWGVPFCGVIISLALCPLMIPRLWSHHYGKITICWAALTLISIIIHYNYASSLAVIIEILMNHYVPFMMVISALYIVTGNIRIDVDCRPTPMVNTLLLLTGSLVTNIIGTTGAAMLLIQPLISINKQRRYKQHSLIFFIFLVGNIGGCLSPLGDPPLFLGYLNGVSFDWLLGQMWLPFLIMILPLIVIYYGLDTYYYTVKEQRIIQSVHQKWSFKIDGTRQFILIGLIICTIITNGLWTSPSSFSPITGHHFLIKDIVRDLSLLLIAFVSYKWGKPAIRVRNNFSWHPLIEIGKIFAAIFITAMPVVAMLQAGPTGALQSIANLVSSQGYHNPSAYFWLTGLLSAFLDNAPTYLIFFNIAGGQADHLMNHMPAVLTAISSGAVFMGALSYIGNAPNFMVKSIAESEQIYMPSFFGYMLWSCGFLLPLFALMNYLLF